jgi:Bacterial SH3 domain
MRSIMLILAVMGCFSQTAFPESPVTAHFSIDRTRLHAGEAFLLTLEFRISGDPLDKEISIAALPPPGELQIRSFEELPIETVVQGEKSTEIRRFRTWARVKNPGSMILAPRLDGTLIQTSRTLFIMQQVRRSIHIPVEPFPLTALPLPEAGRPSRFSGLVGNYTFNVKAAPLDIALGDLITLTFTVEGDWLPETFSVPQAASIPGIKVYDAKPVPGESNPTRQVFRQIVIPQENFIKALPSFFLTCFDSRESRYKTLSSGPFPITLHAERAPDHPIYVPTQALIGCVTQNSTPSTERPSSPPNSWWTRMGTRLQGHQRLVIQEDTETTVRFGPSDSARELFALQPGTPVTVDSSSAEWVRISCSQGIGWIPKKSAK